MQGIFKATMLVAMIALLAGACDSDGGDGGNDFEPVPATNLDCENNWDSAGGDYSSGGLDQTVTMTFSLPDDYNGEETVYMVGAAVSPNDNIPTSTIPVLVGQSHFNAGPLTPGSSFTFTTEQFNRLPMIDEQSCGNYYYLGAAIYFGEMSFPTNMEWLAYSDAEYQIGGDPIVVDVGEMAFAR